ncbi:MAG: hypothetical protein ACKVII_07470 [Planctomycetales bacterium]|jgi:hypothetical protein
MADSVVYVVESPIPVFRRKAIVGHGLWVLERSRNEFLLANSAQPLTGQAPIAAASQSGK